VIIPAYQAEETIDRCLDGLARQTVPRSTYEILVVDDGSTDATRVRVEGHDGVQLLTQSHAGPAAARNLGLHHAAGDLVLFTDADCEPAGDWIETLVDPLREGQTAGAKGTYLSRQRQMVARFVQMEYEDKYDLMARRMAQRGTIDFIDTYSAAYRRDILVANGGFEIAFPRASVEDQELSFRLARRGYKMAFVPAAHVYHWGHPQDLWAYARKKFNIGYWKVLVHRRHPGKMWRDSHTPQVLKAQILLVGLGGLCLAGALLWPPLLWGLLISVALFLASTLPFAVKARTKDPAVAVVSPGLLFVRALALGVGFAVGLLTIRARGGTFGEARYN